MEACRPLERHMLPNVVEIRSEEPIPDFSTAKRLAVRKISETVEDPFLLAWYDGMTGKFSPDVICCGDDKPSWLVYAESRGGDISVDVNDLQYVFVFMSGTTRDPS